MPLNLDTKRVFSQRTDRVKGVDLHPTEPWLLACLYSGHVHIWNYNDGSLTKSFEVTDLPVRAAKFIVRKQWIVCGSDDMTIRIFNYNTMDKVKSFEAHTDYIRSIAVHPTLPYILTSSDDMLIKLWDWDSGWNCTQIFEGHAHYVMQVVFNPKDTNNFASASLDRTVKVWSLGQSVANFTLEGHEKGVNTVDYFGGGDRPYLASGADDKTIIVWDYQTKAIVHSLKGHTHNVSAVCFHPEKPIIVSGSEDGSVRIFHSTTFRLEDTINEGKERVWTISCRKGLTVIGIGYDEGVLLLKLGKDEPLASMDSSGKFIWAKNNEIQTTNVKSLPPDYEVTDGERLPLPVKDLGSTDAYPHSLQHNRNGRFVAVCGDGEYIVYTALAWRNKSFGNAEQFVWSSEASEFAIKCGMSRVQIFKNFQEKHTIKCSFTAEKIFGGALIGIKSSDFIVFYDWSIGRVVRRIDVAVKDVFWSDSGDWLAITTNDSFYILEFKRDIVDSVFSSGETVDEDGIEDAFEVVQDITEQVVSAAWIGDCFLYNNNSWRLNYCVGGEISTLYHLDRPMYLLGYMASQSRVYLVDKEFSVTSYTLLLNVVEYKTLVIRGDMEAAEEILKTIPEAKLNDIAKFLEARELVAKALEVATDLDYKFELAMQLGQLETAQEIAEKVDSEVKWKQLGELAMSQGKLKLCEKCFIQGRDVSGLLLLYSSKSSRKGITKLIPLAKESGKINIVFMCHFLMGDVDSCIEVLVESDRLPEAAFFARTYAPSRISDIVALWKKDVHKINPKAAESLADPQEYPNLFPDLELGLKAEMLTRQQALKPIPASKFPEVERSNEIDLIKEMKSGMEPDENGNVTHSADQPPPDQVRNEDNDEQEEEEEEEFKDAEETQPPPPPPLPLPEASAQATESSNPPLGFDADDDDDLDDWGLEDDA